MVIAYVSKWNRFYCDACFLSSAHARPFRIFAVVGIEHCDECHGLLPQWAR